MAFDKMFSDKKKAKYAEDTFVVFNQTPGDTRTKDKVLAAGYSLDIAQQYINYNAKTEDAPGYDEIQDHQKYNNATKVKFSDDAEENRQMQWQYFFDVVIPATYTGQRRKLEWYMRSGKTLEEALALVKDSEGNPLNTIYGKDEDGNKYVYSK